MLPAIAAFVAAMRTFYLDWVPQLCVATTATALRKEADAGFSRACCAVDFARSLAQMAPSGEPSTTSSVRRVMNQIGYVD